MDFYSPAHQQQGDGGDEGAAENGDPPGPQPKPKAPQRPRVPRPKAKAAVHPSESEAQMRLLEQFTKMAMLKKVETAYDRSTTIEPSVTESYGYDH